MPAQDRIVFGIKPDWNRSIARHLDAARYEASFAPLDAVDLARFRAVIPLRIEHYDEIRRASGETRNVLIPSPAHVALCDDKAAFNRHLIAGGFEAFVPRLRERGPPYPYIWKPRHSEYGRGCRVVRSRDEEALIDPAAVGFAQDLVDGRTEFAVHLLCRGGRVLYGATAGYRMAAEGLVRGEDAAPEVARMLAAPPDFVRVLHAVVAGLGYTGTCCFDVKLGSAGPMILEMNPRFGATLVSRINPYVEHYLRAVEP